MARKRGFERGHRVAKPTVSLLITDVDNTLFDWLGVWHASFGAMINRIAQASAIPREQLEREFRQIHQRYGTVEYGFSIEQLPCLQKKYPNDDLRERFSDAIDAYRSERDRYLRLYPGVEDTLKRIRSSGTKVVAYTESPWYITGYRIRGLGLDGSFDRVYSPPEPETPRNRTDLPERYPREVYGLMQTLHRTTAPGELKPNPRVLLEIIADMGGDVRGTAYVGDSLVRDVAMAQAAGVIDVYAAYGAAPSRPEYDLLTRVSHWTDEQIARDRELRRQVTPTYVLNQSFGEVLDCLVFEGAR